MTAVLAIGWQPELRGILITIIAVVTFCGSCYFLLSTNLGARLGFLVAFAALAGWIFLMGATWWTYGKGLLGPDASWAPVSGQTVLQTTDALNNSGALDAPILVDPSADPTATADAVTQQLVRRVGGNSNPRCRRSSRPALQRACCSKSRERCRTASSRSSTCSTRVASAARSSSTGGSTSSRSSHAPHYALVEVAPLIEQREEPGRRPRSARSTPHVRASTCT